ncbi:hypothetical protein [Pseudomonas entomophila]|uniref:hypothetical protein n=1 Tax=Pseudomonas entomophila TaxID=312306 RepID=UPI003EC071A3
MTSSIASCVHGKTTLIINNMQVDLLPMIRDASRVLEHCCWLAELAQEIELPVTLTCHEKLAHCRRGYVRQRVPARRFQMPFQRAR